MRPDVQRCGERRGDQGPPLTQGGRTRAEDNVEAQGGRAVAEADVEAQGEGTIARADVEVRERWQVMHRLRVREPSQDAKPRVP